MTISKPTGITTTILALLNGMFGGSIMVLPILALQVGWFYLALIIIMTTIVNWYSCHLVLLHLGNQKDIGSVIVNHFKSNRIVISAYNFTTTLGLLTALVVYFKLILIQIQGLFLNGVRSELNSIVNGIVIAIWCVLTKIWDIDTHISGYGFFSIAAYFVFLFWVAMSAPSGQKYIVNDENSYAGFTAVMNNALTIQFIFIPILKSYTDRAKYPTIMAITFIFALVFYFYIDGVGAYGIMNRQIVSQAQTIQGFFLHGQWQLKLIQAIYLLHLYSVFPQYLLAGKKRFYSLLGKYQDQSKKLTLFEVLFIFGVIFIAVSISLIDVNLRYIIQFNGTVFGFIYCYIIPVILHLKCTYFSDYTLQSITAIQYSKSPVQLRETREKQDDKVQENRSKSNKEMIDQRIAQNSQNQLQNQNNQKEYMQTYGQCYYIKPSLLRQIIDLFLLALMLSVSGYVLVYGLMQIFK